MHLIQSDETVLAIALVLSPMIVLGVLAFFKQRQRRKAAALARRSKRTQFQRVRDDSAKGKV